MPDSEFTPEIRNAAWWSTDTRRAVTGDAVNVVLEKQGKRQREDIGDLEQVQMGKVMQPVIGKLLERCLDIPVIETDYSASHPKDSWLRAHTDFTCGDALVETKNYNLAYMNQFSEEGETVRVPESDYFQCLHEATCFEVETVYLAVLFGGQKFRHWRLDFTPGHREAFRKTAAEWWAHVANGTTPKPETPEQARAIYPRDVGSFVTATRQLEEMCQVLKHVKSQIKALEGKESELEGILCASMRDAAELRDVGGTTLATWKSAKDSRSFDREAFQSAMPDLYNQFCVQKPGSRRFLLK